MDLFDEEMFTEEPRPGASGARGDLGARGAGRP
jgi:hypothetical protein